MKTVFLFFFTLAALSGGNCPAFVLHGVPFVKQAPDYCGPAALEAVMAYYGTEMKQADIGKATYNRKMGGVLITDLENFARRNGFATESGIGTLEKVKEFITGGKPVIVLVDLGIWAVKRPHYLVLFGHDAEGFVGHDGNTSSGSYPYSEFKREWEKMGCTYLLVYR